MKSTNLNYIIHLTFFTSLIKVSSVYNPFFRFSAFHNIVNTTIACSSSINLTSRIRSNDFLSWLSTTKPKDKSVYVERANETNADGNDAITTSSSTSQYHHINDEELQLALDQALKMIEANDDDIKTLGWKLVQKADHFSLYKRRSRPKNEGPYEYMMTGEFSDVSPKCWLQCQVQKSLRGSWDDTMKSMSVLYEQANNTNAESASTASAGIDNEDIIYYRTKWYVEFKILVLDLNIY